METRNLTKSEEKVVAFLRAYYKLVDEQRLTGTLYMSGNALEIIEKNHIAKSLKVEWGKTEKLYAVTFTLSELKRYIDFCCSHLGMIITLDGHVITFDKFKINLFKKNI